MRTELYKPYLLTYDGKHQGYYATQFMAECVARKRAALNPVDRIVEWAVHYESATGPIRKVAQGAIAPVKREEGVA